MSTSNFPARILPGHVAGFESGGRCDRNRRDQQQCPPAQKIDPAIKHMLQHVNQPLRVSTLSATAGVSASHFFSLFKSVTGCSPIDFFIRLRMHHACELLRNRKLTIKRTAALLGYKDPFYFSRIFKLVTGVAPQDYRNMILDSPREKSDAALTDSGNETAGDLPLSQVVSTRAFKQRAARRTSRPVAV